MKTLPPIFLSSFLLNLSELPAQNVTSFYEYTLDINNINTTLDPTGTVGYGTLNTNYFYAPASGLVPTMFGTWLWLVGTDQNDIVRDLCPNWYFFEDQIKVGPFSNKYDGFAGTIPELLDNKYSRVWKVSKDEIETQKLNYANTDYIIPEAILNWPGNGDRVYGTADLLAPFTDYNANNIYEPLKGDHPNIKGDLAVYSIYNDHIDEENIISENPQTDLEVHVMLYAYYDAPGSVLHNTVFVNYKIINRGNYSYDNFYAGIFSDFELGAYDDDYVGCDSSLNLMYVYNGDLIDGPVEPNYGNQLPAFGCVALTDPMHSFMYRNNDFTVLSSPNTAEEIQLCLDAKFLDGVQMTYGGNGYNTSPDAIATNYMFSGEPANTVEWTEVSENNAPADRIGYGSTGPYYLNSGDELCVEFAYVFAQLNNPENNLSSIYLLKNYVTQLHALFPFLEEEICLENKTGVLPEITGEEQFFLFYPNPSAGMVSIHSALPFNSIFYADLFNTKGQRMKNYTFVNSKDDQIHYIDVSVLSTGIYFLRFKINGFEFSEKLIVK